MGIWYFAFFTAWEIVSVGLIVSVLIEPLVSVPFALQYALAALSVIFWGLVIYDDATWERRRR